MNIKKVEVPVITPEVYGATIGCPPELEEQITYWFWKIMADLLLNAWYNKKPKQKSEKICVRLTLQKPIPAEVLPQLEVLLKANGSWSVVKTGFSDGHHWIELATHV